MKAQAPRLLLLDLARSLALLGMVAFHLSYDLLMFGILPASYAGSTVFYFHARIVAGSFIFLAGLGLWLAHGSGIRWPAFWRRFVKIIGAAALVTLATWLAMPDYYIYFGILHAIAVYSLLGLLVLRLPGPLIAILATAIFAGGWLLPGEIFNAAWLRFTGLGTLPAMTVDFEPLFPWFGTFLYGVAVGKIGQTVDLWARLARWPPGPAPILSRIGWPGRKIRVESISVPCKLHGGFRWDRSLCGH